MKEFKVVVFYRYTESFQWKLANQENFTSVFFKDLDSALKFVESLPNMKTNSYSSSDLAQIMVKRNCISVPSGQNLEVYVSVDFTLKKAEVIETKEIKKVEVEQTVVIKQVKLEE